MVVRLMVQLRLGGVSGDIASIRSMTIDVAGDIILDADGGDVTIKDGGTSIGHK